MDRDYFIIYMYCLVEEFYQSVTGGKRIRQRGFKPKLSDIEVITIELCGEYFKLRTDKDIFEYFMAHYAHFFPGLKKRTTFVRQAANLWAVKQHMQHHLTVITGQAEAVIQTIDTMPLPVCTYSRSIKDRCFKTEADYGYCASKRQRYYGFKLGLRISQLGMITHYPLLPSRQHDSQLIDDLIAEFAGVIPADKGFINQFRLQELARKRHVEIITPQKRNNPREDPHRPLRRTAQRWRKLVETVGGQLVQQFGIDQTRAHDLWHYQHRLIRKILTHTICIFVNLQLGRPPLRIKGIVRT